MIVSILMATSLITGNVLLAKCACSDDKLEYLREQKRKERPEKGEEIPETHFTESAESED
mgnify:CR=1 FL=1